MRQGISAEELKRQVYSKLRAAWVKLRGRRLAYQNTFDTNNVYDRATLEDLAQFCHIGESASQYETDRAMHIALGRQEVWLRIAHHLNLSLDKQFELYSGQPAPAAKEALRQVQIQD